MKKELRVDSNYSLEDSMQEISCELKDKIQEIISKRLLKIFTEFITNKNIICEEIQTELSNKGVDDEIINFIIERIDSIIFSHYDEDDDYTEEDLY